MELTRYDRARLASILGAPVLVGHAVAAGVWGLDVLRLPMEAGGLFLGPLVGLPLLFASVLLLSASVLLFTERSRELPVACIGFALAGDLIALFSGFRHAWLVAGTVLAGVSMGLFASLVRVRGTGADRGDQLFFVALFALLGFLGVIYTLATGGRY